MKKDIKNKQLKSEHQQAYLIRTELLFHADSDDDAIKVADVLKRQFSFYPVQVLRYTIGKDKEIVYQDGEF